MPIVYVIVVLAVIGILIALLDKYGTGYIDGQYIRLIKIVAVVGTLVWLLRVFGVWQYLWSIKV